MRRSIKQFRICYMNSFKEYFFNRLKCLISDLNRGILRNELLYESWKLKVEKIEVCENQSI